MRREQAERNRQLMPNVAAMMDEFRKTFPDCKLLYAKDFVTGHEVGKKEEPDPDKVFTVPDNYYPSRSVNLKRGR
jgi:hypothetical protein